MIFEQSIVRLYREGTALRSAVRTDTHVRCRLKGRCRLAAIRRRAGSITISRGGECRSGARKRIAFSTITVDVRPRVGYCLASRAIPVVLEIGITGLALGVTIGSAIGTALRSAVRTDTHVRLTSRAIPVVMEIGITGLALGVTIG